MKKIEIFDPAMCCSTGVCGPGVDPELLRMATMVSNLQKAKKTITRHNLSEEPQAYIDNGAVNDVILNEGADALPITVVDGKVLKTGEYPTNDELLEWCELSKEALTTLLLQEKMDKSCSCGGKTGCC